MEFYCILRPRFSREFCQLLPKVKSNLRRHDSLCTAARVLRVVTYGPIILETQTNLPRISETPVKSARKIESLDERNPSVAEFYVDCGKSINKAGI